MAIVNTFLCNCGRTIGRPADKRPEDDAPPQYAGVAWYARPVDAPVKSIRCGSCSQWWTYLPAKQGIYCEVRACCTTWRCSC